MDDGVTNNVPIREVVAVKQDLLTHSIDGLFHWLATHQQPVSGGKPARLSNWSDPAQYRCSTVTGRSYQWREVDDVVTLKLQPKNTSSEVTVDPVGEAEPSKLGGANEHEQKAVH